jgi:hypothetical protein
MTVFGMAALLAPVVGPTLGGYITDTYGWRWIFYLNVPIGILAFFLCHALVTDPEYLEVERAKNRAHGQPFDTLSVSVSRHDGLLGSHAQQGGTVGLARRSVLSGADAVDGVRAGAERLDLSRVAAPQPTHPSESPDRPELRDLLHCHLLRLRHPLRQHHQSSGAASVSLWL